MKSLTNLRSLAPCALVAIALVRGAVAQANHGRVLGATAVLERVKHPSPGSTKESARTALYADLTEFGDRSAELSSEQGAREWLRLLDRYFAMIGKEQQSQFVPYGEDFSTLVVYLPRPESWPLIEHGIKGQGIRSDLLRLLMSVLQGRSEEVQHLLEKVESERPPRNAEYPLPGSGNDWFANEILRLRLAMADRDRDTGTLVALLKAEADSRKLADHPKENDFAWFDLPNLVPLLGRDRAREIVTYILTTAKAEISDRTDLATLDLAREVAVSMPNRLAAPQWTLAQSMDVGDFYTKFNGKSTYEGQQMDQVDFQPANPRAGLYYFAILFASGKTAQAQAFADAHANELDFSASYQRFGDQDIADRLAKMGKLDAFLEFLERLALKHPDSSLSQLYFEMAKGHVALDRQEGVLRRLLDSKTQDNSNWKGTLFEMYLEDGKTDAAIKLLPAADRLGGPPFGVLTSSDFASPIVRFRLGRELRRSDLVDRGLAEAQQQLSSGESIEGELRDELLRRGKGPEIEKALIHHLQSGQRRADAGEPRVIAKALVGLYFAAGRYQDVLTMLERYPGWGVSDLGESEQAFDTGLRYMATKSLAQVGRNEEAVRIALSEVARQPSDDQWCELIAKVDPAGALGKLAAVERSFPGEAVTAYWTAKLLWKAGRPQEAETAAQRAIDLDPDDVGHWGKKERFEARILLARIARAKGDALGARNLEPYAYCAVWSVQGQRYEDAGMMLYAETCYQHALEAVPSDFESRLKLASIQFRLGAGKAAEESLLTAFTLAPSMVPSSLEPWSYGIPSTTLIAALRRATEHGSPSASEWAVLGALEASDGAPDRAVAAFRAAVKLDPDCVPAWQGLSNLRDSVRSNEAVAVFDNLARLGGASSAYGSPGLAIVDYARVWNAQSSASKGQIRPAEKEFDLAASRRNLEAGAPRDPNADSSAGWNGAGPWRPGTAIGSDDVVRQICELIRLVGE